MIGKSEMRVMIDERPVELTGQELTSFLSTIPIENIKEVEIITNPSAKYDAQGNSGIINIVSKKGRQNAWSNKTSYVYNQAFYSNHRLSNSFIYNKDKLSLVAGLNGTVGHMRTLKFTNIYYSSDTWSAKEHEKLNVGNLSANLDLNYTINNYNKIGIKYLGSTITPGALTNSETKVYTPSEKLDYILNNNGNNGRRVTNNSYNLHYEGKLDTIGTSIHVNVDYFNYGFDISASAATGKFVDGLPTGIIFSNYMETVQNIDNYSVKADIEHPAKFAKISYGGKFSFTSTKYITANYNTITGSPVFNPLQSNDFTYSEDVRAVYLNGVKSLNDKWEMQLGLRLESTLTNAVSNQNNQTNKNNYLNLFPTSYLSYQVNEKNSLNVTYGRRLDRPNFFSLNPARYYSSSNAYSEGNPFLRPEISTNFELNHIYDSKLTTSLFLTKVVNGYGPVLNLNDQDNIQVTNFKNYYDNYSYGLSESYSFNKISWLESQLNVYLINSESKFYDDVITAKVRNGFQFYLVTNNSLSLSKKKGIKGQIDFMYSSPYNEGLYALDKSYSLDIGINFESLLKNFVVSMSVADIFNTSRNLAVSRIDNVDQDFNMYPSNRFFRATISYTFGNKNIKSKKRTFGNDDEKNRSN